LSLPRRLTLSPHGCKSARWLERNEDKTRLIRFGVSGSAGQAWRGKTGSVPLPGTPASLRKNRLGRSKSGALGRQTKAEEICRSCPAFAPAVRLWYRTLPSQSTTTYLEEAGSIFDHWLPIPHVVHAIRTLASTPDAIWVTSKVRTVCSSSCKYGPCGGWLVTAIPTRRLPGPGLQTPRSTRHQIRPLDKRLQLIRSMARELLIQTPMGRRRRLSWNTRRLRSGGQQRRIVLHRRRRVVTATFLCSSRRRDWTVRDLGRTALRQQHFR